MVIHLAKEPSVRLLKHVVRCYLRLSDNQRFVFREMSVALTAHYYLLQNSIAHFYHLNISNRACEALQQCLPDQLRDATFAACLQEDKSTKHWLSLLIKNVDTYSINPRVGISPS